MMARISCFKRTACLWAFAFALASVGACPRADADSDPFKMDTGHWMSFDHYKDADKRGILGKPSQPAASDSAPEQQTAPVVEEIAASQATQPAAETVATTPVIATPKRALDLPLMPGLNKGFQVKVNSTEDDMAPTPAPVISANAPTATPDLHISDKNWQDPALMARYKKSLPAADANDDDVSPPIDVRMSYLPNSKITPTPSPEHVSAEHLSRVAFEKNMANKNKPPAETTAACAAIDAYKKQQLDAIQSDRQTLKALQDAIASLGLQKQLGFMAGGDSSLNAQSTPQQVNVDIPVSAPTTVR
jgi:hypothetical protein